MKKFVLGDLVALAVVSLIAVVGLFLFDRHDLEQAERDYRGAALDAVVSAAGIIERQLTELKTVDRIAAELAAGDLTRPEDIEFRLRGVLQDNLAISSLTLAYTATNAPDFFPSHPQAAVQIAGVRRDNTGLIRQPYTAAQIADKTRGDVTAWYRRPLEEGRPVWLDEPYFSPASNRWWSGGYGVPFSYTADGAVIEGVIYADLSVQRIQLEVYEAIAEKMNRFPVEASYAFVVSHTGFFLSHPDSSFVQQRKKLSDFDPVLKTVDDLDRQPSALTDPRTVHLLTDHRDQKTGQTSWVFFTRLAESGWRLAIVLDKGELSRVRASLERANSVNTVMAALLLIVALVALAVRVYRGDEWRLWTLSLSIATLALAGTSYHWYAHRTADPDHNLQDIVVLHDALPEKLRLRQLSSDGSDLTLIPTGVFVQSVEFSSANNVTVTGYIWQRYAPDVPETLRPRPGKVGFVLPESEETIVDRAFEKIDDEGQLIGWYFKAVLRQDFDYSRYPFDSEVVWVRIWHSHIGAGVALKPDFVSYNTLDPDALPGVETVRQGFVLEGWRLERSFFSYRLNSYNTNFGFGSEHAGDHRFPELYFNIALKRIFLNPFINYFIPLGVVSFLLFGVLMSIPLKSKGTELASTNTLEILGFCAALFFVVILAHTSLHDSLAAQRIVYFEYFYFITYVAILGVAINSILIASPGAWAWVRYRQNLLPRLLYWPAIAVSLLLITHVAFD